MGLLQQKTHAMLETARRLRRMGYMHPILDRVVEEYADTNSYDYPRARVIKAKPKYALVGSILLVEKGSAEQAVIGSESMEATETVERAATSETEDTVVANATPIT